MYKVIYIIYSGIFYIDTHYILCYSEPNGEEFFYAKLYL